MKFSEIIGQESVKDRVREAMRSGRMAHAQMLVGPSGVGKLAMANAIAQYLNCLQPTETDSCGTCTNCQRISRGLHPDVHYALPVFLKKEKGERMLTKDFFGAFRDRFFQDPYLPFPEWRRMLDAENKQLFISAEEIRQLKKTMFLKAFEAPVKVAILWNVEAMRKEGANAFLKLLEEPPDRTFLLLTCSDPSQLLTTINSRVQRIKMERVDRTAIRDYLIQKREIDADLATEIAAISEGSPAAANEYLSESSQQISALYAEWLRAAYLGKYDVIQQRIEPIYKSNKEFQKLFLQVAVSKIRDSLLYHLNRPDLALVTQAEQAFQEKFSQLMDVDKVSDIARLLESSYRQVAGNANSQLVFTALSLRVHGILRR